MPQNVPIFKLVEDVDFLQFFWILRVLQNSLFIGNGKFSWAFHIQKLALQTKIRSEDLPFFWANTSRFGRLGEVDFQCCAIAVSMKHYK